LSDNERIDKERIGGQSPNLRQGGFVVGMATRPQQINAIGFGGLLDDLAIGIQQDDGAKILSLFQLACNLFTSKCYGFGNRPNFPLPVLEASAV
jgi:hypothetical protein